jgi:hypothetical protein
MVGIMRSAVKEALINFFDKLRINAKLLIPLMESHSRRERN